MKRALTSESEIRKALRLLLHAEHAGEADSLILDEMVICEGEARVDFAVVNSAMIAYEIKSSYDTLSRLPRQQAAYCRVFDRISMVSAEVHVDAAEKMIPPWWGIIEARKIDGAVALTELRPSMENPNPDPLSLAKLLWRDEALAVLARLGMDRGVRAKPRGEIWTRLSETLPASELGAAVRESLKARGDWRSGPRQVLCDGSSRLVATS